MAAPSLRQQAAPAVKLIPRERFVSPDYLDLEMERLWPRVWQMACREEEIAEVGEYVEYRIGDQSILIIRTDPATIRAYFNSCLHRGTLLRAGCGKTSRLRCRYHGWCWNLDGTVQDIPYEDQFPELKRDELRLPECRVDTWGGFVFVNPDPDGEESLANYLGPIVDDFARYRFEEMRLLFFRTTRVPCNWKTALDAFVETHHSIGVHPQTLTMVDPARTVYDAAGYHTRMVTPLGIACPNPRRPVPEKQVLKDLVENLLAIRPAEGQLAEKIKKLQEMEVPQGKTARDVFEEVFRDVHHAKGLEFPEFPSGELVIDRGYHVFPNMKLNAFPGSSYSFTIRPDGMDPDSALIDAFVLTLPAPGDPPLPRVEREFEPDIDSVDIWGLPMVQDYRNFPLVQRGLHSRGSPGLRLGENELTIRRMHEHLDIFLGSGAPAPSRAS